MAIVPAASIPLAIYRTYDTLSTLHRPLRLDTALLYLHVEGGDSNSRFMNSLVCSTSLLSPSVSLTVSLLGREATAHHQSPIPSPIRANLHFNKALRMRTEDDDENHHRALQARNPKSEI